MGEEGREELALDIFEEKSSSAKDGEVRGEGELLDSNSSKKLLSEFANEGESKEQEEVRGQIQVQERIQVLFCLSQPIQ